MAHIQRRPPAKGRGPQDFDAVVTIFIDNPERAFNREEIVQEVQQGHPSISERRIEYIRKQLFKFGYIRHETVGGPYEKRYIYTGNKWYLTQPPTRSTHCRPCEPATLPQWRELLRAIPPIVSKLAQCALDDDSVTFPLHDALLESGLDALAEHFGMGCVHAKCWALPILAGVVPLEQFELSSKQAAAWLGISEDQFNRIVRVRGVQWARDKTTLRGGYVRHTYKWAPTDIAKLIDDPKVITVRPV